MFSVSKREHQKRWGFGLVIFLWLCFALIPFSSALAVTLPFSDDFSGASIGADWDFFDNGTRSARTRLRNGTLEIKSAGVDVWTNADDYATFYLDNVNGDFTAIVQIAFQENTNSWAKAGIMLKNQIIGASSSTGYVILAATPRNGYAFQWDGDDNGRLGSSVNGSSAVPPDSWLKLEKTGQVFRASYSSDGSNWTLLTEKTQASANVIQDVGLFVCSANRRNRSTVRFDNFSISGAAVEYTYYRDLDADGYGSTENGTVNTSSATPPAGYLSDNTDCNDNDNEIYPGFAETCDGKDNDCDGLIDEDVGTATYFFDGDGDGYGTDNITQVGCTTPPGYSDKGGDCVDGNSSIYPGAADECGDGVDQDCDGSDRLCGDSEVCLEIADMPLVTQIEAGAPMVMLLLDDSGSMAWDVACPESDGKFYGSTSVSARSLYWKSQWTGYNRIYYDTGETYDPWVKYVNADTGSPKEHPLKTDTQSMDAQFASIDGVSVKFAHYYAWSAIESVPYLVIISGTVTYYKVTNYGSGDYGKVYQLTLNNSPPSDIQVSRSYNDERQNYANWYKYYRTRELVAKASLGRVIEDVSGLKLGIHTLNGSVSEPVKPVKISGETDYTDFMINKIYAVGASGYTPLRKGLEDVGQYYHADDGNTGNIGTSPYNDDASGGACQHAFVIAMTDGYYNGETPGVGNADGDADTAFDGVPFADNFANTLSDVAMYYYEKDLSSALPDSVPTSEIDQASHQHMVTYTISFGLRGTLTPNTDCPSDPAACPAQWPDPEVGNEQKIDQLYHSAVNGRGEFLTADDTRQLVAALTNLLTDIQDRARTGAPVSINTQKLEENTALYQGFFDSVTWSGDLQAFAIDPSSGEVNQTPLWKAKDKLNALDWNSGRTIITFDGASGKPFRYASLTAGQKSMLTAGELDYIRGDISNELKQGGTLRDREGNRLGDIVNSSPIFFDDNVFVGANDGMLHAFSADTGNELFAYIPGRVFQNLKEYTNSEYEHKYFVDNTPYAVTVGAKSWLIGGLGKGGRGYFGIDITSVSTIRETAIPPVWEYPLTEDNDMGFSYSQVSVLGTNATTDSLIMFANGYDSPNGHAVLYFLNLDGTLFHKIDTGVGGITAELCNGLSTPVPIDVDQDKKVDYVFAGDLLGNLWKFDLTDKDPANWGVAYKEGAVNKPLFQAKGPLGTLQPIIGRPAVMEHCQGSREGYIVVFGTGRYLSFGDISNAEIQTVYGIWDWADEWEKLGESYADKYMGYFKQPAGTPAARALSIVDNIPDVPELTLLQQTQTVIDENFRETTNYKINWFSPQQWVNLAAGETYSGGNHVGWYFDLPTSRERMIARAQIRDGKAIVVSIIPSQAVCTAGGSSVAHVFDACNGGQLDLSQFDTNGDGKVDKDDDSKSGKVFDNIYYAPAIIENKMYFSKDVILDTRAEIEGIHYWRLID